ncbi:2TM domain-containing protein [Rhodoferax mekongensis]|uniref:2TM domain-containing protein n=1 Tax=Rhodoferax mekongensis TaxID=3068341 RepID=A0ABZ0AXK2_9BURK|nr:2TM domain-containing protein [Rhodoferax sp. TBRC 17307]WNO04372.1 2TM domain-containing protein [Rhodoferax sp. TBRC 17307]
MNALTHLSPAELDRLARKRAGAKMGWYIHALVFVLVNAGLAALSALQGQHWAVFPTMGWGLGLAVHGVVVYLSLQNFSLFHTLLQRERQRLETLRDPW